MRIQVVSRCVSIIVVIPLAVATHAFSADSCGPFGDPPARVDQGWFAGSVSSHNPICFGGKVLGPWKDGDGTERYACLYEPPETGAQDPLPLVLFFHESIATADSVKLTGLPVLVTQTDLGGKKPGFILIALEGRYASHFYPKPD